MRVAYELHINITLHWAELFTLLNPGASVANRTINYRLSVHMLSTDRLFTAC
jgi:hypothetical protein